MFRSLSQELVEVLEFFIRAGIGVLYIRHDDFVVVHELGERLAEHWVDPVCPGHLDLPEVPLSSHLIVDQRHKHKLVLQAHRPASGLDSHGFYSGPDMLVDFVKI